MTDRRLFASITVPLPGTFADDARIALAVGGEIEKLKAALTKHGIAAEIEEKTVTVRPKKAEKVWEWPLEAPGQGVAPESLAIATLPPAPVELDHVVGQPTEREAPDVPPAPSTIPPWAR